MGDEGMQSAEPRAEHHWLQKLVGEWTYESEAILGPDQPPMKSEGSESVRSLGGLWTLAEGRGEMPEGGQFTSVMTLGYDPERKRFVGTWIGSVMTHLWLYEGELDEAGKVLALHAEGPTMTGDGKTAKYKDEIEILGDDHRTLTSSMLGEDGNWHRFVTAHYRRKAG